jgi:hypothetical protein
MPDEIDLLAVDRGAVAAPWLELIERVRKRIELEGAAWAPLAGQQQPWLEITGRIRWQGAGRPARRGCSRFNGQQEKAGHAPVIGVAHIKRAPPAAAILPAKIYSVSPKKMTDGIGVTIRPAPCDKPFHVDDFVMT